MEIALHDDYKSACAINHSYAAVAYSRATGKIISKPKGALPETVYTENECGLKETPQNMPTDYSGTSVYGHLTSTFISPLRSAYSGPNEFMIHHNYCKNKNRMLLKCELFTCLAL